MTLTPRALASKAEASFRAISLPRRLLATTSWAAVAAMLWLSAAFLYHTTRPVLGPETLVAPGAGAQAFAYPFRWHGAQVTRFDLRQQIWLPASHPTVYGFYPQDILYSVAVNGYPVQARGLPLSVLSFEGRSIDLAPHLVPGLNMLDLQMEVRWGDARFRLAVSPWDEYALMLLALSLAATGASAAFLARVFRVNLLRVEALVVLAGIGLRFIYFSATPYYARSFDYWGHVDYLDHVLRQFSLPAPGANWEWFQPPLYYFFLGGLTRLCLALGMAVDERFVLWQGCSLLFSVGVLVAGYGIAFRLYKEKPRQRVYLLGVLAVAPPLVFNAARVSNDSLAALLAFIWLALLLHYAERPGRACWFALAFVLGLALLTKATALALVAVSLAFLLLDPRRFLSSRLKSLASLAAICGAMAGWYYLTRLFHAHAVGTYVVGNLDSLNPRARIDHVFEKSFVFNPLKVVRYPFDETWGPRNDRFLEVFFKTMLLGEWIKGPAYKFLGRLMVLNFLLLMPPFAIGLRQAMKTGALATKPLLLTLVGVFFAQWLFLQEAPYLSTQDFRFSVILLIPFVFYLLEGLEFIPEKWQAGMTFLLQLALLNMVIYLSMLTLG